MSAMLTRTLTCPVKNQTAGGDRRQSRAELSSERWIPCTGPDPGQHRGRDSGVIVRKLKSGFKHSFDIFSKTAELEKRERSWSRSDNSETILLLENMPKTHALYRMFHSECFFLGGKQYLPRCGHDVLPYLISLTSTSSEIDLLHTALIRSHFFSDPEAARLGTL